MANSTDAISTIHQVARRLEGDIRDRRLQVGDKYLTAHQAAEMLGVSRATAQRALKLLADDEKLLRRRNLGTFVGPGLDDTRAALMRSVYVLGKEDAGTSWFARSSEMIRGIREGADITNVSFGFVPRREPLQYLRHLIDTSTACNAFSGIIVISCEREVYQMLGESGIPTVVFGTLYQETPYLASIDIDNRAAGRLAAEHLVERGHRRISLIAYARGLPGDHEFLDGVCEALAEAGLPANALVTRFVPQGEETATALRDVLRASDIPKGTIVRTRTLMGVLLQVADELGIQLDETFDFVGQDTQGRWPFPGCFVRPEPSMEAIATRIGGMLKTLIEDKNAPRDHVFVPVRLEQTE